MQGFNSAFMSDKPLNRTSECVNRYSDRVVIVGAGRPYREAIRDVPCLSGLFSDERAVHTLLTVRTGAAEVLEFDGLISDELDRVGCSG